MSRLIILFLIIFPFFTSAAQDSLVLIIRVDDIQSRNTTTLPRSINDFQNAVEAKGGKVTWAVIPHRLIESQNYNGILSTELRKSVLRGHEICMHGYNHICTKCLSSGHEMFCTTNNTPFTFAQQQAIIDSGLKVLWDSLGVNPKSFVPPAHVADTTTWAALVSRNFVWLSSTGIKKNYIYNGLYNLPPHNEFTWQITQAQYEAKLSQALTDIKTAGVADGYYCLLLHDPFIRAGYENGLVVNWIGALLDSVNAYFGSRVKYMTVSEAGSYFRDGITTKVDESIELSSGVRLEQNYPNPFKQITTIKYTVASQVAGIRDQGSFGRTEGESGNWDEQSGIRVSVRIYDILGREVAAPVDEIKPPGSYECEVSVPGAPGIYFCTLSAGEIVITRKMLLMR